jgi:MYXO-CTERM domain-containing protein
MKTSSFSKFISAGILGASLAVLPLAVPAQAQTQNTAPDTTSTQRTSDVDATETNDDFNWGWLGLLGLAGLAGLARKNHRETVHTHPINDPDLGVRSGSDYRR